MLSCRLLYVQPNHLALVTSVIGHGKKRTDFLQVSVAFKTRLFTSRKTTGNQLIQLCTCVQQDEQTDTKFTNF